MKLAGLSDKIRNLREAVIEANKERLQTIAANEMEALIKQRVFGEGKDSKGGAISSYSTKEMYVNPDKLSALVPKGGLKKGGKYDKSPKFENGKPRKTAYLGGGYKEFKSKANFDSGIYNLTLTGASKDSIGTGKKGGKTVLGYRNEENRKILEGHEIRLGKQILAPTDEEREIVRKRIKAEIDFLFHEEIKKWK